MYTADGTQTSCVNIQYYDDPLDSSDDDDYYSQDPCETEAAKQEALAAAAKTCTPTENCQPVGNNEYGGCILDHGEGSPGFFNTEGEERMYCIVGTAHASDTSHAYNDDESISGLKLTMDSSSCADLKDITVGDVQEVISYDACDAMLAKNAANMADLKAAAADAAAARAALKAGLTCLVEENCDTQDNGDVCYEQTIGSGHYVCELKEGTNPEGELVSDGSQTACAADSISIDADGDYVSSNPCGIFAAKQESLAAAAAAEAEAQKSCDITNNCKPIAGNDYGGCVLDITGLDPQGPEFFAEDGKERMYCVVGTTHITNTEHPYNEDTSVSGLDLDMGSSACKDVKNVIVGNLQEEISYDICDAMLAKNEANMAELKAAAADAAAARAAARAGLTCNVKENCVDGLLGGDAACLNQAGVYRCALLEQENPDGVMTNDGSATSCNPDDTVVLTVGGATTVTNVIVDGDYCNSLDQTDSGTTQASGVVQAECMAAANELLEQNLDPAALQIQGDFNSPPGCYKNLADGQIYFNGLPNGANAQTTTDRNQDVLFTDAHLASDNDFVQ